MKVSIPYSLDPRWLIRLRWLSAIAQCVLILFAELVLEIDQPLLILAVLVAALLLSNVWVDFVYQRNGGLSRSATGALLILDTLLLFGMLASTGGPANPFSIIFIVHVALAAVMLGPQWTWALAVLASLCFAALFLVNGEGGHDAHSHAGAYSYHLQGMLVAFVLTALLVAYFVSKVAAQLQEKELLIRAMQRDAMNQARLQSLATLAAGAAHELATPLSTIAIAAGELSDNRATDPATREDVELIRTQVARCREVLDQIAASGGQLKGELPELFSVDSLLADVVAGLPPGDSRRVCFSQRPNAQLLLPRIGLRQSLTALICNALEASFAEDSVTVQVAVNEDQVSFEVEDTGSGMPEEVRERIGEPFFSTKEPGSGTGLGVFLVQSFADLNDGNLSYRSVEGRGTVAKLQLPRRMEMSKKMKNWAMS